MKIDDKAVVPIGWVLCGMGSVVVGTITGVFWVATVNFRLQRIEEKLGIPPYHSSLTLEDSANAKQGKAYANGK